MNKLTCVIMGQDCEKYLGMCLESVNLYADNTIYLDGGATDNKSTQLAKRYGAVILQHQFNQKDKLMNSKQKNFFLEYLKKNYINEWVLYLDADEVIDDLSKVKEFINSHEKLNPLISIKMRHFENTFGTEDATHEEHFVPHRLFKVNKDMYFPDGEHTVLWKKKDNIKLSNVLSKSSSSKCSNTSSTKTKSWPL